MAGYARLGKGMLIAAAVVLGMFVLLIIHYSSYITDSGSHTVSVRGDIRALKTALHSYEVDYHHFPIPQNGKPTEDFQTRSRGVLLQVLLGENISMLNPQEVRYDEFRKAKGHRHGLWQDGTEWVLSDYWCEPFHIILDTNKDDQIANPEFGADQSNSEHAAKSKSHPPPEMLPLHVLVYSSGPDRDPKTWRDNVCSWRAH